MEHDQRILDIISATVDKRPADIEPLVQDILGERIARLVADRKTTMSSEFYGEPVVEEEVVAGDEEIQPVAVEDNDDENA